VSFYPIARLALGRARPSAPPPPEDEQRRRGSEEGDDPLDREVEMERVGRNARGLDAGTDRRSSERRHPLREQRDEQREADRATELLSGHGHRRGDALVAVGDARARSDVRGRERDSLPEPRDDHPRDQVGERSVRGKSHVEEEPDRAERHPGCEGACDPEPPDEPSTDLRPDHDRDRQRQEAQSRA
jgi:hypothetical protein